MNINKNIKNETTTTEYEEKKSPENRTNTLSVAYRYAVCESSHVFKSYL